MKSGSLILAAIVSIVALNSCEQEEVLPESKEEYALTVFDGAIIGSESDHEDGVSVWKLKIENEDGAVVELYLAKDENRIVRVDGESGPFTYEMDPKQGLKTFSQTKITAVTELKNDNLRKWRLRKEDEYHGIFVYTFEFEADDNDDRVEVDGESGNVLSIE